MVGKSWDVVLYRPIGRPNDVSRLNCPYAALEYWRGHPAKYWLDIDCRVAVALFGSTGIEKINFKNFVYPLAEDSADDAAPANSPWRWFSGEAKSTVRLVNGRHDFTSPDGHSDGYLLYWSVTYGDLNGDGEDEAAVDLLRGTGGTKNWHYLYVFSLANGSPRLVGTLMSGSRADGGLVSVKIVRGILSLDFQDADRREGDCCSRGIIRVRYRIQEGRKLSGVNYFSRSATIILPYRRQLHSFAN